eukprot:UN04676
MLGNMVDYNLSFEQLKENEDLPLPFLREFNYSSSKMVEGKDVYILQHLINRWDQKPNVAITSKYDSKTSQAVKNYKIARGLPANTDFTYDVAKQILADFLYDNYKDTGIKAADMGLLFKIHVPVYRNRSIETTATLYDAYNNPLHKYTVRTRAHTIYGEEPWPSYDSATFGLNELTGWGYTPSGLTLLDVNTPEPEEVVHMYGEWNVLRAVRGIEGNAEIAVPYIRNGILQHTGRWPDWDTTKPMPNSAGCMHVWPEDQKKVTEILTSLGAKAHKNPFGQLPYPYPVQGLLSVEVIDDDQKP